ncbi:hypothetical protein [Desulfobacter latus]|uniref:Uncharacterized protein n=1 Tax=Desulfobacter latus TaxID=2292 RepID=A0A850TAS0_9BACT|nr:hypothetical protein [Desulfobacter latus]NWH05698.1 hypothetical protein [Desulfobacter latus]
MCGYCVESIGVERLLTKEKFTKEDLFFSDFFIQEIADLNQGIHTLLSFILDCEITENEKLERLNSHIILCRLLEILIDNGMDSPKYGSLLQNEWIIKSIVCESLENTCRIETLNRVASWLPHLNSCYNLNRWDSDEPIQKANKRFPNIHFFYPLYQADTYFNKVKWHTFLNQADLPKECMAILNHYISWWLKGGDLKENDSSHIKERLAGTGVIYDPIMTVPKEERVVFDLAFRALFFSACYLSKLHLHNDCVKKLILTPPSKIPFFDGMDLWLQRKATERIYRFEGVSFFLHSIDDIRTMLPLYLMEKCNITGYDKNALCQAIKLSKQYDDDFEMFYEQLCCGISIRSVLDAEKELEERQKQLLASLSDSDRKKLRELVIKEALEEFPEFSESLDEQAIECCMLSKVEDFIAGQDLT